jgi:hypothetical protein
MQCHSLAVVNPILKLWFEAIQTCSGSSDCCRKMAPGMKARQVTDTEARQASLYITYARSGPRLCTSLSGLLRSHFLRNEDVIEKPTARSSRSGTVCPEATVEVLCLPHSFFPVIHYTPDHGTFNFQRCFLSQTAFPHAVAHFGRTPKLCKACFENISSLLHHVASSTRGL